MQRFMAAFVLSLGMAGVAAAQDPDCFGSSDLTQSEMNFCARKMWEYADQDLNDFWPQARAAMKEFDSYTSADAPSAWQALLASQKVWIAFRDANCDAVASTFHGGTIQPTIYYSCLEDMTRLRTEELRAMTESN